MVEDYVSFETAKLLKEKGFDAPCEWAYTKEGIIFKPIYWSEVFPRPTIQMAMKWLREVHNIDIDIDAKVGMIGVKVYVPMISTYRYDASDRLTQKQFGLYYKEDNGIVPALQYFKTYEEAAEAAIRYCLENLINI